jgi:hypothetical protein
MVGEPSREDPDYLCEDSGNLVLHTHTNTHTPTHTVHTALPRREKIEDQRNGVGKVFSSQARRVARGGSCIKGTVQWELRGVKSGINRSNLMHSLAGKCPLPCPPSRKEQNCFAYLAHIDTVPTYWVSNISQRSNIFFVDFLVIVTIGALKRTLAGKRVHQNGSIDTNGPPQFSLGSTFNILYCTTDTTALLRAVYALCPKLPYERNIKKETLLLFALRSYGHFGRSHCFSID